MIANSGTRLGGASRFAALCTLVACHAALPAQPPKATASATPARSELCRHWRMTSHGPVCLRQTTAEAQRHSDETVRFEYEGANVARRVLLNGRGGLAPDSDDCTEYRYRYQQGTMIESTGYRQDGSVCDRTLFSDAARDASLVDAWGRPVVSSEHLHTRERIERDAAGFVTRLRFFGLDGSPVNAPLGAHEIRFERNTQGLELKTCYFDAQGAATNSNGNVHCVRFRYDEQGNDVEDTFFDVRDQPTENNAGSHRVAFEFDAFGNLTGKRYLRLDGSPISIENGSCAALHFQYDERGFRTGADCFDGAGRPARWRDGNASWRASPDAQGHAREYRYFDPDGNPISIGYGYARYEIDRDASGHVTERRYFLVNGQPGQKRGPAIIRYEWSAQQLEVRRRFFDAGGEPSAFKGCASIETEYDAFRQATRQTCRDAASKLAAASDGAAVTEWSFDSRGRLLEQRFYDAQQHPGRTQDGVALQKFTLNALGFEAGIAHFAADGSRVHIPRFKTLGLRVSQPDEFWPARSREVTLAQIEAARAKLLAGADFTQVLNQYSDETVDPIHPGDLGYREISRFYSAARVAVESLAVGQYSEIVELPFGFALYQRTE